MCSAFGLEAFSMYINKEKDLDIAFASKEESISGRKKKEIARKIVQDVRTKKTEIARRIVLKAKKQAVRITAK